MKRIYNFIILSVVMSGLVCQSFSQTQINYRETFYDNRMKWTVFESEDAYVIIDSVSGAYIIEEYTGTEILCRAPLSLSTKHDFSYSIKIEALENYWCSIGLAGNNLKIHFEVDCTNQQRYRINFTKSGEYKFGKWKKLKNIPPADSIEYTTLRINCKNKIFNFYLNDIHITELKSKILEEFSKFSHLEITAKNSDLAITDIFIAGNVYLDNNQKYMAGEGIPEDELKNKEFYYMSDFYKNPSQVYKLRIQYPWKKDYLPQELFLCRNLQKVEISAETGVNYSKIIEQLSNFPSLQVLIIDNIDSIPQTISKLNNLRSLTFIFCKSRAVPEEIGKLYKLKHLDLFRNDFVIYPKNLSNLRQLEYLSLAENDLNTIPDFVFQLHQLDSLDIGYNNLEAISEDIGNLKELKYFNVSYNDLKSLPQNTGKLKKLIHFKLSSNMELTHFPKEIGDLESLEIIDMSGCDGSPCNGLQEIPKEMGKLTNLKELNFGWCCVKQVPEEPANLKKLESFYIKADMDEKEIERVKKMFSFVKNLSVN